MRIAKTLAVSVAMWALASTAAHAGTSKFTDLPGNPELKSASALVMDDEGNVIYGKDVNAVRPIASITKLMTAMVVLDAGLSLDEKITITKADRDLIRLTGSRLQYGASLSRREMILLALMSSENRAATALGRTYPGGMENFIAHMNRKARALGMQNTRFADPAGLKAENVSTAADLARMVKAAEAYPLITEASTTTRMDVYPFKGRGHLTYGNTNRLLKNASWDIELSKTGYINEAGRCLVMNATIEGEDVSIVLLNSFGKLTPFGDSNRLRKWMLASS
ncbi:D-alanyl-D-alanine endopeptidase [Pseudohalioglobus sediminis]|uniref:D-alanyl-D-alanine endopeptidase n=1 Tax=Pseudohalioglobus sediminis TaxID=2606449 RepID=A0A5B0WR73_9GAMM|nr:D-alanyl-D-alanine endopeptidase [Pseudohalioglobus sediminis]KAA1189530.1 D-alanyl-D-alanine endopeptidase [Pseudohalioglobus sediminis]